MVSEANQNNEGVAAISVSKRLMRLPSEFTTKVGNVMKQLKKHGKEDPRRIVHSFKVALAITLVSLFYYYTPLYDSFGPSAMWAVFTVVVVSEFTVGKFPFSFFPYISLM